MQSKQVISLPDLLENIQQAENELSAAKARLAAMKKTYGEHLKVNPKELTSLVLKEMDTEPAWLGSKKHTSLDTPAKKHEQSNTYIISLPGDIMMYLTCHLIGKKSKTLFLKYSIFIDKTSILEYPLTKHAVAESGTFETIVQNHFTKTLAAL